MGLKILCAVLTLLYCSYAVQSAAILALFSSLSYTDHLVFRGYISLLTQKGHTVVLMTPYPGQFQYPDVEKIIELDVGQDSAPFWDEYRRLTTNVDDYFPRLRALNEFSLKLAIVQLKSQQMQALLINPNIKFDLVITEADVPLFYAVAEKYKVPHISITTSNGKIHQYEAKGNPIHPILYPDVNTLNYKNLTRWQKVLEFYRHLQTKNEYYNHYLPLSEIAAKKLLGLQRDLQEVEYDIDLLLIAANPILVGNRPTVPAIIYADRLHLRPNAVLPQNWKTVLDSATKGVIYFSLGVTQDAELLSPTILQTMSEAFKELPFTVLWKIGNTTMINKPDNVIAEGWFPQQELLSHPNVKAFITHGGARSLEEAIYYQVPIVGLPIVRSRKPFIREVTKFGTGEILDPYQLDKETLKATISAVATDDKYKQAMIKLKDMIYDPVISGPENALWWTEYVLRHNGARHLRSPAVGVSFFKYYMLDLLSYFLIASLFVLYLSYLILRYVYRRLRQRFRGVPDLGGKGGKFKAL
ncbi:UDP-glycosyltransferase UGT5 [Amyelois transitella]|uniref:UDP-glycosyltransferase UGT5 n=1 Tax=Amyelois transitella TaxID=680683 RepID=UPI00298F561E|nr:UDP-glycosyltransferase UGT5 [Amyelois transitella]